MNAWRLVVGSLVACVVLLVAIAGCGSGDDGGPSPSPTPVRTGDLTSGDLQGRIIYTSTFTGSSNIWLMDASGENQQNLTSAFEGESFPDWSADGSQIVFQRGQDIWIMGADGSDPTMILKNASYPRWLPAGDRLIVTVTVGDQTDLALVDPDGENFEMLTETTDQTEVYPAVSPDGEKVAYLALSEEGSGIRVRDLDEGGEIKVTDNALADNYPAWSPAGDRIAFAYPEGGIYNLATINPDGTGLQQLTTIDTWDSFPAWSPDGCCIAFISTRDDQQSDVYVMRANGENVQRLTTERSEEGVHGIDWAE